MRPGIAAPPGAPLVAIYALIDPRSGAVRYVGRTIQLAKRYRAHLGVGGTGYRAGREKREWIAGLQRDGLRPALVVLERCADEVAHEREAYWIAKHAGPELLNRRRMFRPRRGERLYI